jgi:beta-barrel assembly-enhancing protease
MHAQRMAQVFVSLLIAVSVCCAQQSSPEPKDFSFTQVDLELLDKSNQLDSQFQEKGLVYNDPDTTKYITKVGQAVLPGDPEYRNVHWQFFILRDAIPNAFALPNGSIYVHSGMLAVLENEAQLAAVLAREETHVLNRDGYLQNRNYRKNAEAGTIIAVAAGAGGVAGEAAVSWIVWPGALTVQLAVPAILQASIRGYGREPEQAADLRAVHALADAGYSTEEIKRLFEVLQQDRDLDLNKVSFYQDRSKLQERSNYVDKLLSSLPPPEGTRAVEADRYTIETEAAVRHDADLEIRDGSPRTALWVMEHIVKRDDKLADNFYVLGEAYRGLGARTPEPLPEELTNKGKDEARKMLKNMTPQEYESALLKAPGGRQTLESNEQSAEKNYTKAIVMDPNLPGPHRGLGYLYEEENKPGQSTEEFKRYLELDPSAVDAPQIQRRLEEVEKGPAGSILPERRK